MAEGSAGALLRAAREKQGLHIAALAAAIKVPPKKLEALEADRWDELAGVIFTRALAQSVCRVLRIDAKPVLALLPQAESPALDKVRGPLNAPFRDAGGRADRPVTLLAQRVLVAAALLLLVAAAVLFVRPSGFWRSAPPVAAEAPSASTVAPPAVTTAPVVDVAASAVPDSASAPVVSAVVAVTASAATVSAATGLSAPAPAPLAAVQPAAAAPQPTITPAPNIAPTTAPTTGTLRIEASAPSWVEVRERGGRVLLSRQLAARESIGLDGPFPLALTVGNAAATKVTLRGTALDLGTAARNNVARIEVQ